jgi:hypothetical protein
MIMKVLATNRQTAEIIIAPQVQEGGMTQVSSKGARTTPAKAMAAELAAATKIEGMSWLSPRVVRSRVVVNSRAVSRT